MKTQVTRYQQGVSDEAIVSRTFDLLRTDQRGIAWANSLGSTLEALHGRLSEERAAQRIRSQRQATLDMLTAALAVIEDLANCAKETRL